MSALEDAVIAYGCCHCGCGEKTRLAHESNRCHGYVKGHPIKYLKGHSSRMPRPGRRAATLEDAFYKRIKPDEMDPEACWPWPDPKAAGYGTIQLRVGSIGGQRQSKTVMAHRAAYELLVGSIPDGLELDHLCRNRACVNPAHLEPVTSAENTRRGAQTRLTAEDVAVIRASPKRLVTAASLARRFGVSAYHIHEIRRGTTWTAT